MVLLTHFQNSQFLLSFQRLGASSELSAPGFGFESGFCSCNGFA